VSLEPFKFHRHGCDARSQRAMTTLQQRYDQGVQSLHGHGACHTAVHTHPSHGVCESAVKQAHVVLCLCLLACCPCMRCRPPAVLSYS
jgi:hypothetical protein